MKKRNGDRLFQNINNSFFAILCFIMLFPLWNVLMTSFVSAGEFFKKPIVLWPDQWYLDSYQFIFGGNTISRAFVVTVFITVVGSLYSMTITTTLAYGLSKKSLPGRHLFLTLIMITMFFNGGLIPYYLLINKIGLYDSIWVLILPMAVNTYNFIIIKSFFANIPTELEESARIDGANDITIFTRIILPLSMPVLATFLLFYGVSYWNSWWNCVMFIQDNSKFTLQYVLRQMIVQNVRPGAMTQSALSGGTDIYGGIFDEGVKMATVIVATVPILAVYPFLQKYFVKGVMIGSVKG